MSDGRKEALTMGISHESSGQIRDILRKLDRSIDTAREKRLQENAQQHADNRGRLPGSATPEPDNDGHRDDYGS